MFSCFNKTEFHEYKMKYTVSRMFAPSILLSTNKTQIQRVNRFAINSEKIRYTDISSRNPDVDVCSTTIDNIKNRKLILPH